MHQEKMLKIISGYINAYNALDVPGMLSFLHPDIILHNVKNGQYSLSVNGKEEFGTLATQALGLFKSRTQTIQKITYADAKAKADINYEGVLAVNMDGFGLAGETKQLTGRSEFVFKDGLIHILTDHI